MFNYRRNGISYNFNAIRIFGVQPKERDYKKARLLPHRHRVYYEGYSDADKQPFLAPEAAIVVTAQRSLGANDAMPRNHEAEHVGAVGAANRAARSGNFQFFRHPGIGAGLAGPRW
jgi:hypothetical protein